MLLGGDDAYSTDRDFVSSLDRADREDLATVAMINRFHLPAVAARLVARGIDQYLDLGCGLPQSDRRFSRPYPSLYDVVALDGRKPRVVYAYYDKNLFGSARFGLEEHPLALDWVIGDIRHMKQFLISGRVRCLLDWTRPIGVLLHDVLPCIEDEATVTTAMAMLREQLPPGSALSITHAADLGNENPVSRFTEAFHKARLTFKPRSAVAVKALFGSWPLEPPGLAPTHHWHQDHPYAALAPPERQGRLPGRPTSQAANPPPDLHQRGGRTGLHPGHGPRSPGARPTDRIRDRFRADDAEGRLQNGDTVPRKQEFAMAEHLRDLWSASSAHSGGRRAWCGDMQARREVPPFTYGAMTGSR